jgi:hypothetical protein
MYTFTDTTPSGINKKILEALIKKDFKPKVERNKTKVMKEATAGVKKAFSKNNFVRNPIDTGESQKKSYATVISLLDKITLNSSTLTFARMDSFTPTKQRKFYENGWGPNEKYGLRNPRKYHAEKEGLNLLKKLID